MSCLPASWTELPSPPSSKAANRLSMALPSIFFFFFFTAGSTATVTSDESSPSSSPPRAEKSAADLLAFSAFFDACTGDRAVTWEVKKMPNIFIDIYLDS